MNRKLLSFTVALSLIFTAGCTTQQKQKNNPQPIQGVESSVNQMGNIQRVKVTADTSNVRSGCSGNTPVLKTAAKDSTLDVVSQVSDWFAVKLPNNQIGFVHNQEAKPVVVENNQPNVTPDTTGGAPQVTQGNATSSTAPKTPSSQTNSGTLTAQEQQMLNLVNQARAQNNVPPLQIDMQVTNVARIKAQDMIDNNYFSHNSPKYGSPFDMMKSFGVSYVQAGENIAGNQTVPNAENALMNSPGHRKNILNPAYTHIGIGIKSGGPYGNMFSQMFVSKPK
ncbi:CAP domain-containing protein [Clostridium rhizosphaerae]